MNGIDLKLSIEQFGFRDGFKFWFTWSFISPLENFIWLNTHKPYCLYSGWYCKNKNCSYKHLTKKKDILNEWKKHKEESNIVEGSEDEICFYCGEEKGTEIIDNPNWDNLKRWLVCKTCKEVIKLQQEYFMLKLLPKNKEIEEKMFNLNNRLLEIEKATGKKIFSSELILNGEEVGVVEK